MGGEESLSFRRPGCGDEAYKLTRNNKSPRSNYLVGSWRGRLLFDVAKEVARRLDAANAAPVLLAEVE